MKPTPQAIENAAREMLASVIWSSFWSPDDARALAKAALSADLGDMVLVPREPTKAMMNAVSPFPKQLCAERNDPDYTRQMQVATQVSQAVVASTYRAMLAAAKDEP